MTQTEDLPSSPPFLGAHFSVAGGLENAVYEARRLDCTVAQIFTKNARTWKEPELSEDQVNRFKAACRETGVTHVFSHCTYLINIASNDPEKLEKSRCSLTAEMARSARLGLDGVVLHPGAHLGRGMGKGLGTAIDSLVQVLAEVKGPSPRLLIETTAGTGTTIGSRFQELRELISGTGADRKTMGICLDTSHIFAAGYDIRTAQSLDHTLAEFDAVVGLDRLFLIHANDSIPDLGSCRDRHTHIGMGKIGLKGFAALMTHPALADIPKLIETPKEKDGRPMDRVNLSTLRKFTKLGN
ncbi:MAG: deoxyribonuclease IV [Desulfobacter sp.]|nr:MAG: deoxyribonuclease IV [Desulfobacter sp.]